MDRPLEDELEDIRQGIEAIVEQTAGVPELQEYMDRTLNPLLCDACAAVRARDGSQLRLVEARLSDALRQLEQLATARRIPWYIDELFVDRLQEYMAHLAPNSVERLYNIVGMMLAACGGMLDGEIERLQHG